MQEPDEPPPLRFMHHGFEPVGLLTLGGLAAAKQQRVEADQPPSGDVADPAIALEVAPPAREPLALTG